MKKTDETAVAFAGGRSSEAAATVERKPALLIRAGRGKSGGSFSLDYAIQRARYEGRRVRPLDADKRSETLFTAYGPPAEPEQQSSRNPEWATAPQSEEPTDVIGWLMRELDEMAEDRMGRVLDFNGGDRTTAELQRDLDLAPFCEAIGVRCSWMISLGPDIEDFRHTVRAISAGQVKPQDALMILNEGVVPQGQTTSNSFDHIILNPDFRALVNDGIRFVLLRRLSCARRLRELNLGLYEAAYPDLGVPRPSATLQHMTRQWLDDTAAKLAIEQAQELLP